jgi:polypeptide N-acetylgalactosaminyltransferase
MHQSCSRNFIHNQKVIFMCTVLQKPQLVSELGNFEPRNVAERTGPGEGGKPHILRDDQQNDASQTLTEFGMNMICSDELSLSRSIPDTRLAE